MTEKIKSIHELGAHCDKNTTHQYLEVYESFFEPIRKTVTNVLEIGIYNGDSHKLWRDYFPNAHIYGLDIIDMYGRWDEEARITVNFLDAYTSQALGLFSDTRFDVIIDDGPHSLDSMIYCVQEYSKFLTGNGILIIEDIPNADWIAQIAAAVPEEHKNWMFGIDRRIAPRPAEVSYFKDELMFVIDRRFARD